MVAVSYVPGEAFSPAFEDSNTLAEKNTLDGPCLSLYVCLHTCEWVHAHSSKMMTE